MSLDHCSPSRISVAQLASRVTRRRGLVRNNRMGRGLRARVARTSGGIALGAVAGWVVLAPVLAWQGAWPFDSAAPGGAAQAGVLATSAPNPSIPAPSIPSPNEPLAPGVESGASVTNQVAPSHPSGDATGQSPRTLSEGHWPSEPGVPVHAPQAGPSGPARASADADRDQNFSRVMAAASAPSAGEPTSPAEGRNERLTFAAACLLGGLIVGSITARR